MALREIVKRDYPVLLLNKHRKWETTDSRIIDRIEASSNYSKIYFNNGRLLVVARILSAFQKELEGRGFVRVHDRHLVNIKRIASFEAEASGRRFAALLCGTRIPVSQRKSIKNLKKFM